MKDMRWACGITGHGHGGLVYTCKSNGKTTGVGEGPGTSSQVF